jgi:hypothetical protein
VPGLRDVALDDAVEVAVQQRPAGAAGRAADAGEAAREDLLDVLLEADGGLAEDRRPVPGQEGGNKRGRAQQERGAPTA